MAFYKKTCPGSKNLWRHNLSVAMKRSAEQRKCKKCGRKNAISRFVVDDGIVYRCRWCDESRFVAFEI